MVNISKWVRWPHAEVCEEVRDDINPQLGPDDGWISDNQESISKMFLQEHF